MAISINLLPPEIKTQERKKAKFYKIQFTGVVIILTMVFLASLTVALRILQSRRITQVEAKLNESQKRVSDLKSTQGSLFILKDRLTVINQYLGVSSKQTSVYKLIESLLPQSVVINAVSIDKASEVTLLAVVPDSTTLDIMVNNLIAEEANEGKISQVSVDNLNRGRDGLFRVSLKIKPK